MLDDPVEAEHWRLKLELHGIQATVGGGEPVQADSPGLFAVYNLKLSVPSDEAQRATKLLQSRIALGPSGSVTAHRALLAAFVGLGIPPLQAYSLYLIARLLPRWRTLSPRDRRRVYQAALLDLWFPFIVVLCVLSFGSWR